jgi:ubiquitin carboxyl-terminal hydrolase 8
MSGLTLAELQGLIVADEDSAYTPKQWLDRAQHEADLAVLAERRGKKEDMFVAYSRCYKAFMMAQTHSDYAAMKKADPNFGLRIKAFKEVSSTVERTDWQTSDAYLSRAKDLKEVLKQRDVEKGVG